MSENNTGDNHWGYYDKQGQPIGDMEAFRLRYNMDKGGVVSDYARIGYDKVDGKEVSTVWLGLDHNWLSGNAPLIFETMIFGGDDDQSLDRYHTEAEAIAGHKRVVDNLRAGRPPWGSDDEP